MYSIEGKSSNILSVIFNVLECLRGFGLYRLTFALAYYVLVLATVPRDIDRFGTAEESYSRVVWPNPQVSRTRTSCSQNQARCSRSYNSGLQHKKRAQRRSLRSFELLTRGTCSAETCNNNGAPGPDSGSASNVPSSLPDLKSAIR